MRVFSQHHASTMNPMWVFSQKNIRQSISNQTHVSVTLANHLFSNKSNIVFSPLSLHVILGMMTAGSKGETLDQLLGFLKTDSVDDLNSLFSQLVSLVFADGSPCSRPRLCFANGVWVDQTLSLKPSFKQVMDNVYKDVSNEVDFQTKADEVTYEVNLWVEKQTSGLINDILPAGAVNSFTTLIFANAVYFKGAWSQKFDTSNTKNFYFHLLDGSKVRVPFMTNLKMQLVSEYDGFKVLGLPYLRAEDKRVFKMYFFLPDAKDGLPSLIDKMGSTSDFLDRYVPRNTVEMGQFFIPKFKISFGFEASDTLKELGVVLPFRDENGMTEMVDSSAGGNKNLNVSRILNKSFVEVNEEGTEAAAASVYLITGCARGQKRKPYKVNFVADHPFLFVIREDKSGVVLFMGQVLDPSAG